MYGEYDECKGCVVMYMYNKHYVHVYKKMFYCQMVLNEN